MYYTVIRHSGHLRTVEKSRKDSLAAPVFYISFMFSNARHVLSQCNTRPWLIYLLNIFAVYLMLSLRLEAILVCLALVLLGIEVIFTIATMITFKR